MHIAYLDWNSTTVRLSHAPSRYAIHHPHLHKPIIAINKYKIFLHLMSLKKMALCSLFFFICELSLLLSKDSEVATSCLL